MLTIFAVSDSIGETANQVAVAAASQFGKGRSKKDSICKNIRGRRGFNEFSFRM